LGIVAGPQNEHFVSVKSLENQAKRAVPGTRSVFVRQRTMLGNALRCRYDWFFAIAA
jgi:hypothetical protein